MENDLEATELIGKIMRIVAGEFMGWDALVLSVNKSAQTARVAIAAFGGLDAKPIELDISCLSQT